MVTGCSAWSARAVSQSVPLPWFPGFRCCWWKPTKTRREGRAAKPNLLLHINPGHAVTLGSRGVLINDHAVLKCSFWSYSEQLYFCHLAKSKVTGLFMFVSHKVWSKIPYNIPPSVWVQKSCYKIPLLIWTSDISGYGASIRRSFAETSLLYYLILL